MPTKSHEKCTWQFRVYLAETKQGVFQCPAFKKNAESSSKRKARASSLKRKADAKHIGDDVLQHTSSSKVTLSKKKCTNIVSVLSVASLVELSKIGWAIQHNNGKVTVCNTKEMTIPSNTIVWRL